MMGRYGSDQLNLALLGLGIVMILLGTFLGRAFAWASLFNILCYIPLILCIFRMYSRNIAARHADVLFDFPWVNDFSAARNAVLDRCTGKWTLTVDADESGVRILGKVVGWIHNEVV